MKVAFYLTVFLSFTAVPAQAVRLADHLPAGALLTLESNQSSGAVERFVNVAGDMATGLLQAMGEPMEEAKEIQQQLNMAKMMVNEFLGEEAVVGIFTVGNDRVGYKPEFLAVSRANANSKVMKSQMKSLPVGAKVGRFTITRQKEMFVGYGGPLVYASSNKALLMSYLGRLSGKKAPTLSASEAYNIPVTARGQQEFSFFVNFSAGAKILRNIFQEAALPRLFAPVVDALDTLGSYSGGMTTTASGINTAAAHRPNMKGKDKPLLEILTHTTEFNVQNSIPAEAETVVATACHKNAQSYVARWLTRVDLFEPFGALTDSQLAHHLERSSHYLGDECAQVALAGTTKASLDTDNPLASLGKTVYYQKVENRAAAEQHLPEYLNSINTALQATVDGLIKLGAEVKGKELAGVLKGISDNDLIDELADGMSMADQEMVSSLEDLQKDLKDLKFVYGFRDDYVVIAFGKEALAQALDQSGPTFAETAAFKEAQISPKGVSWQVGVNLANLTAQEISQVYKAIPDDEIMKAMGGLIADLINRYDGYSEQSNVQNDLVLTKGKYQYRW